MFSISGIWLHSKIPNFYWFLTFSQLFSQLPNKFYNRKYQYIQLTKQKSISSIHSQAELGQIEREGGRKSERLRKREIDRVNEISLGWWQRERDARLRSRWLRRWARGRRRVEKKKKKKKEAWPVQSRQWGRHDLGWLKLGVRLWVELRLVRGLESRAEVTFEIPSDRVWEECVRNE